VFKCRQLFHVAQDCFGYLGDFCFHVNFRTIFSSSVKNVVGIWTGIILNLQVTLNRMDILTVLIPIIHC
jgi:cation transporter-like permease